MPDEVVSQPSPDNDPNISDFENAPSLMQAPERKQVPARDPATGQFASATTDTLPEEVEQTETQTETEVQAPAHSPRLVRMAIDFGMTQDEIASHTPEQLEVAVESHHRHMMQMRRQAQERRQQQVTQAEPEVEPEPALPFDEETVAPEIAKFMKSQLKAQAALEKKLAEAEKREAARDAQASASRLDRAFQKHSDFFGTETVDEFTGDEPHFLRRQAALAIMKMDQSNTSVEAKLAKALKIITGQEVTPAKPAAKSNGNAYDEETAAKLAARKADWQGGPLAAPTHRAGAAETPGVLAAKKAFIANSKAAGIQIRNSSLEEFDG